jgi:hypothetical protein
MQHSNPTTPYTVSLRLRYLKCLSACSLYKKVLTVAMAFLHFEIVELPVAGVLFAVFGRVVGVFDILLRLEVVIYLCGWVVSVLRGVMKAEGCAVKERRKLERRFGKPDGGGEL